MIPISMRMSTVAKARIGVGSMPASTTLTPPANKPIATTDLTDSRLSRESVAITIFAAGRKLVAIALPTFHNNS